MTLVDGNGLRRAACDVYAIRGGTSYLTATGFPLQHYLWRQPYASGAHRVRPLSSWRRGMKFDLTRRTSFNCLTRGATWHRVTSPYHVTTSRRPLRRLASRAVWKSADEWLKIRFKQRAAELSPLHAVTLSVIEIREWVLFELLHTCSSVRFFGRRLIGLWHLCSNLHVALETVSWYYSHNTLGLLALDIPWGHFFSQITSASAH